MESPTLTALASHQVTGTPTEAFYQDLAKTIAQFFRLPTVLISFYDEHDFVYNDEAANSLTPLSGLLRKILPLFQFERDDLIVIDKAPDADEPTLRIYEAMVSQFDCKFSAVVALSSPGDPRVGVLAIADEHQRSFGDRDRQILRYFRDIAVNEWRRHLQVVEQIDNQKRIIEELNGRNAELHENASTMHKKNVELENSNKKLTIANVLLEDENKNLNSTLKETSRRLRMTYRELITSQKELETLIYHASHGLKGPLSTVDGLLYLAKMEVKDEKANSYFAGIGQCTTKMHSLLRNLSLMHEIIYRTKNDSNSLEYLSSEDIRNAINDLILSMQEKIALKAIKVNVFVADELWFATIPRYFYCVLKHLFENAVIFQVDPERRTDSDVSTIEIRIERANNATFISLKDNGEGIAEAFQSRVFEMFFRGSVKAGSGLGLYIVKRVVEKLMGTINLQSSAGQNTIVEIHLPELYP
jgi:signal transduction histidine kinase